MANTPPFNVSTNEALTAYAEVFINNRAKSFASNFLAPIITQDKEAKVIRGLDRGDLARPEMAQRASGAAADRAGYETTTATISVQPWALATATGEREIANQDNVYDIEAADLAYLTEQWWLRRDILASAAYWGAGIWDTDVTPGTLWNVATATPTTDIATGIQTIKRGAMVNAMQSWFTLFVGADVWPHLQERLELRGNAERGLNLTTEIAASKLEVGRVVIVDSVQNTGPQGGADNGAYIFDPDDALLTCTQPSPENIGSMPTRVGAAFTHVWPRQGFDSNGMRLKSYFEDATDAHVTQVDWEGVHVTRNTALGYFFDEAVA